MSGEYSKQRQTFLLLLKNNFKADIDYKIIDASNGIKSIETKKPGRPEKQILVGNYPLILLRRRNRVDLKSRYWSHTYALRNYL